ncbi:potassium channel family protein [Salinactinospora qingdaonensis]
MINESALESWRRRTEFPLAAAALIFLGAWAWPIIDPHSAQPWREACRFTTWLVWALFAVDYTVSLVLAQQRWRFVKQYWFDLLIIALPLLRPLRALRLIHVVQLLNRRFSVSLRGNVSMYVSVVTALVVFCAAVAVLDAERGAPGANIDSLGDALWWAATTVTTVGYGDYYPVTVSGRLVAMTLFLAGIALLGVVTGTLASWFTERVRETEETATATQDQVAALTAEVRALRQRLEGEQHRRDEGV